MGHVPVWLEGFEAVDQNGLAERYYGVDPNSVIVSAGSPRFEGGRWHGWSLRGDTPGSGLGPTRLTRNFSDGDSQGAWAANILVDTPASLPIQLFGVYESDHLAPGLNNVLFLEANVVAGAAEGFHKIEVRNNAGTLLGATADRPDGFWEHVELDFELHNTLGKVSLLVEGLQIFALTGLDTIPAGAAGTEWVAFAVGTGFGLIDDIVISDDIGPLGMQFVVEMLPVGSGPTTDWVPSDADAERFELINDQWASDGDTTSLSTVDTNGQEDVAFAHAGAQRGSAVDGVQLEAWANSGDADDDLRLRMLIDGTLYGPDGGSDGAPDLGGYMATYGGWEEWPPDASALNLGRISDARWAVFATRLVGTAPGVKLTRAVLRAAVIYSPQITPATGPSPLRTPPFPNWTESVHVETSFPSDVAQTLSGSESRRGLLLRPQRILSFLMTGMTRLESWALRNFVMRHSQAVMPLPFWPDQAVTDAASSVVSGNTKIPLEDFAALRRRLFPGAKLWVFLEDGTLHSLSTISRIDWDSLTISGTPAAIPAGSLIVPSIDAEIELSQAGKHHTDYHSEFRLTAIEAQGVSGLPSIAPDCPVYGHLPALTDMVAPAREGNALSLLPPEWVDWSQEVTFGLKTLGQEHQLGRGRAVSAFGTRPVQGWTIRMQGHDREELFEKLQWLEHCRGRLRPFWFVDPGSSLELVDLTSTHADVEGGGVAAADAQDFIPYLAFIRDDQTLIAKVDTVAAVGDLLRFTFLEFQNTTVAVDGPALVVRCAPAYKARLAKDAFEEEWVRAEVCVFRLDVQEIYEENDSAPQELFP